MRKAKWLVAAGLLASATGCVEANGYPGTSMGGYGYPGNGYNGSGYGYGQPAGGGLLSSLFNQPTYYQPQPQYYQPQYYQPQPQYIPVPVASQPQVINRTQYVPAPNSGWRGGSRSSWGRRDDDGDGIPNRYDRDRNNDGIPDRQQRRGRSG